ncbi:uncharacterized protein FFM5_06180 [Fusarium fujikuroi]|nr:uncharacterized protein FFM5_06180 [Fusarium fujikuroi]
MARGDRRRAGDVGQLQSCGGRGIKGQETTANSFNGHGMRQSTGSILHLARTVRH